MNKRLRVQQQLNVGSNTMLALIKRGNLTEDLIKQNLVSSEEELNEWRTDIIVELYDDIKSEEIDNSIEERITQIGSAEEMIGLLSNPIIVEGLVLSSEYSKSDLKMYRLFLINKLYNDLDHVKEFNQIIKEIKFKKGDGKK